MATRVGAQARHRSLMPRLLDHAAGDAAAGIAGRIGLVVVLAGVDDQRRAVRRRTRNSACLCRA